jgi:pimeloyl-ACP methyl ester carboxylesterase
VAQSAATGEIEACGRRLAWRTIGIGPDLLLINGYAATGEDWDPTFVWELGDVYRVICPDNRGLGGSELGVGEVTVAGMAADLEALLDSLGIERLPVIGWSMGGFVAQSLAVRAPQRVAALALIASDPGGPDSVRAAPEVWSRLLDHSGTPREQATRLISLLFPPGQAAEFDREFGEIVAAAQAQLSPQALRAQEAAMDGWHRLEQPRLGEAERPPAMVVHGRDDVVIPAANAELLASRWGAEEADLVDGCTHAIMAQRPQRLAASIRRFFEVGERGLRAGRN